MDIAIFLFDELTALDAVGPYEVFARFPDARLHFVGEQRGTIRCDGGLRLSVECAFEELASADLLLIPGGFGARKRQHDTRVLSFIRRIDATTRITASVCTGAFLLAAAGVLEGRRATTHWAFHTQLQDLGATPIRERVVRDGKYASAAGVSAGIDLALLLALELYGEERAAELQLAIEYDPAPPLAAGNPDHVPSATRERMYRRSHARDREISGAR